MSLENEMERIGRILAADTGVSVCVRGSKAYALQGKIVLPAIESLASLGGAAERVLHGLLDHEVGHAVDTDFAQWRALEHEPSFTRAVVNALEDGVIEARQGKRYLGSAQNLRLKNERFWTEQVNGAPCGRDRIIKEPFLVAFKFALTMVVRTHGGRTVADMHALRPHLGGLLDACAPELAELVKLFEHSKVTGRVIELGRLIVEKAKAWPPEPDLDDSDDRDGSDAEGDDAEGDDAEGDDAEGDDAEGDGLRTWREDAQPSPEDELKQELESKINTRVDEDEDRSYFIASHEWDIELDLTGKVLTVPFAQDEFARLLEETTSTTDTLTCTFEATLRAMREAWPVHGADHGEVDPALLGEYAVGAATPDTIYRQWLAVDDRDVAVAVLVDCSGSMDGPPAEMARQAALAMTQALARCGVEHEVCGFTTWDVHLRRYLYKHELMPWLSECLPLCNQRQDALLKADTEMRANGDDPERYARTFWGNMGRLPVHAVLKRFGSPDASGLLNIGAFQHNLDGEAVLWQARRLAARPEARRIMFVLSDGMPVGGHSRYGTEQHLRDVLASVIDAGIEVYAIGIRSMHVVDLFPQGQWWVVQNLSDLAQVAVTALTEALTNGRTERKCTRID